MEGHSQNDRKIYRRFASALWSAAKISEHAAFGLAIRFLLTRLGRLSTFCHTDLMYVWQIATCHTQTCYVWQDMITPHSGTGQAAYSELLRVLRDDDEAGLKSGTPTLRKRGGKRYWYLRQRLGAKIRETYAGEDTPDLRAEMDQLNARSNALAARRRERSRIVRILRAEGYQGLGDDVGPLLAAMANAGAFRAGGVLVGTHAYRLYEGELGVRIPFDDAAMTMDVDLAARNARVGSGAGGKGLA